MGLTGGLWEAWTSLMRSEHIFTLETGWRGQIESSWVTGQFPPPPWCAPQSELSDSFMVQLHTGARTAAAEDKGGPVPEQHLSRAGAAITGAYTGRASEAVRVTDCGLTPTACTPTHAQHLHQLLLPQHWSPLGRGCWCWEWGEHTLKGNGASWDSTLRASTPAT